MDILLQGSVCARFSYATWKDVYLTEKPYKLFIDLPPEHADQPRTNLSFHSRDTQVHDMRGQESRFSIDENGFEIVKHKTVIQDFNNVADIEQTYFAEMKQLISKKAHGAQRIEIFDWRIRKSMGEDEFLKRRLNLADPVDKILPAIYPHIDQTPAGAVGRIRLHFPNEADDLLKGRVRIINAWRPLHRVENWPLAFCDKRSVPAHCLLATDYVRRHFVGETYFLMYSPEYQWYYLSGQQQDEVAVFSIYDSEDEKGRGCPHASFELTNKESLELLSRESIEVRALVFGG